MSQALFSLASSSFTCLCRGQTARSSKLISRGISFSSVHCSDDNKDYEINPEFINRNDSKSERRLDFDSLMHKLESYILPKVYGVVKTCLEYQNILPKRKGWQFQQPNREYYYKINIISTASKIEVYLEHFSKKGKAVSASSSEWAVRQFLYSSRDKSAAINTGRVFAEKCLKAGIVSAFYDTSTESHGGEKVKAILNTIKEAGIQIGEDPVFEKEFRPGINYDGPNRIGEKRRPEDTQII